jgi:hypothetical protein
MVGAHKCTRKGGILAHVCAVRTQFPAHYVWVYPKKSCIVECMTMLGNPTHNLRLCSEQPHIYVHGYEKQVCIGCAPVGVTTTHPCVAVSETVAH